MPHAEVDPIVIGKLFILLSVATFPLRLTTIPKPGPAGSARIASSLSIPTKVIRSRVQICPVAPHKEKPRKRR